MILHIMSTFPPHSETFVMREIRELRQQGWDMRIGRLRPLQRTPAAIGFEDLEAIVSKAGWFSRDMLWGLLYFGFLHPRRLFACARLIAPTLDQPVNVLKLFYILLASLRLAYRFKNAKVTLIRAHFLHSEAVAARFLSILLQVPYSLTVYTTFILFPRPILQAVLKGALFLVADTAQVMQFLERFQLDRACIHRIYNSVNIEDFPLRGPQTRDRPHLILAVGRLHRKKGYHILLRACALLKGRGLPFGAMIIGEGPERQRLMQLRHELCLEDRVALLGKLSFEEIRPWYYRAALFAMPSVVTSEGDSDGLPTVVIEAMASGLPVIGTRTGAITEAVLDGKTGFIVPADDPEQLAEQMQRLLEDADLRIQFGAEGRRLAECKFDLRRKVELLSNLFRKYCPK